MTIELKLSTTALAAMMMMDLEYCYMATFRALFVQIIHNALEMLHAKDIIEYSMVCKNNIGTVTMDISIKGYIHENEAGMAKIVNKFGVFILSADDIFNIFAAAKGHVSIIDIHSINFICELLYQTGGEPIIKTSYKSNPEKIKETLCFKPKH